VSSNVFGTAFFEKDVSGVKKDVSGFKNAVDDLKK
jgi:hypothetical protein